MNSTDNKIIKALIFIKDNPKCSVSDTEDISDKIVGYLLENKLVTAENAWTIHKPDDVYDYWDITITIEGESKLNDLEKQKSPLGVFSNKTVRYAVAVIFSALVAFILAISLSSYQRSHEKPTQQGQKLDLKQEKANAPQHQ